MKLRAHPRFLVPCLPRKLFPASAGLRLGPAAPAAVRLSPPRRTAEAGFAELPALLVPGRLVAVRVLPLRTSPLPSPFLLPPLFAVRPSAVLALPFAAAGFRPLAACPVP